MYVYLKVFVFAFGPPFALIHLKHFCLLSLYIGKLSVDEKTLVTLYEKESY